MPRMMDPTMEMGQVGGTQAFQFSATRIENLGATEYTLVTIVVDVTGSVRDFADDLLKCLRTAVESCKKSPRANNLLLRVILFSSSLKPSGIEEIHGFKPLGEIDLQQYKLPKPYGNTNLTDASYSGVGSTNEYAKNLMDQDFLANGIVFIITDGDDNASSTTVSMVRQEMERAAKSEQIESLVGILIGINTQGTNYEGKKLADVLAAFANGVGLQFIDAGEVTKGKLAKLAEFVSQSVSSQSQSLGTGGPSQNIAATI